MHVEMKVLANTAVLESGVVSAAGLVPDDSSYQT
jgi:hypothetical protein